MHKFISILFLSCTILVKAQTQIFFEQVVPNEAFNQNYFISEFKDQQGFMWFGTYSALYRFNGYSVRTFVPGKDSTSISNPSVHCIFQDSRGSIWFGTENGLNRYNPVTGKFQRFMAGPGPGKLSNNYIKSVCEDTNGNLWIATYGGGLNVYRPDSGAFKVYRYSKLNLHSLPSDRVNAVFCTKNSEIWIGTESGGLCRYDRKNDNFIRYQHIPGIPVSISNNTITSIYEDPYGYLWFGTWSGGLDRFNPRTNRFRTFFGKSDTGIGLTIRSLAGDAEGNLWLGTLGKGLFHFNTHDFTFQQYTGDPKKENSILSNSIWSLYHDYSGILWIGTNGNGICKFDPRSNIFHPHRLLHDPSLPVNAISEDTEENLWFGSRDGILARYNRKRKTWQQFLKHGLHSVITCMVQDKKGNLWIGTGQDGLIRFDPGSFKMKVYSNLTSDPSGANRTITALYVDHQNHLWIGIYDTGLFETDLSNHATTHLQCIGYRHDPQQSESLSSNIIWSISQDEQENIWVATDKFMDRLIKASTHFEHFGGYTYSCIYPASNGILWVGTYGQGIGKLIPEKHTFVYYTTINGLCNNVVNSLTGDAQGNIWIATSDGLSEFNPRTGQFKNYDKSDGLQGNQFLLNSVLNLPDHHLIVGGKNGFNIFNPGKVKKDLPLPRVIFSDIKLFNKSIRETPLVYRKIIGNILISKVKEMHLSYSDDMFSIEFAALNFSDPEKQKYAYKLEGFDTTWIVTDAGNRQATYTNLDDGQYRFEVRARNANGMGNGPVTSLLITIAPPFYKTLLFRILSALTILLLVTYAYRLRLQQLHRKYHTAQLQSEQELIKLKNEKLDSELGSINRELTTRTLDLIHKNEKIQQLKNLVLNTLPQANGALLRNLQSMVRFIDKEMEDDSHWDQFEFQFNQTHDNFLKRFKEAYPVLTHNDLKVCAYIRMNLQNHEIAALLNITLRAVETSRYRIRKKIKLNSPTNLSEYILHY